MDPYALGLLLGDGCLTTPTTPSFSTADPELAVALEAALAGYRGACSKSGVDYVLRRAAGGRGGLRRREPGDRSAARARPAPARGRTTKFVPERYLLQLAPTSGSRCCRACSIPTADRSRRPDAPAGSSTRRPRRGCATTWSSWSARSAASPTGARARPRDASPGWPTGVRSRTGTTRTSSTFGCPPASQPFRLERKRRCLRRHGRRPADALHRQHRAGRRDGDACASRSRPQDSLYVTDDFMVTHNTLNDAFIILDEAQNTTPEQMKMFLTRLGFGSKVVVTGDVTQVDLPGGSAERAADRPGHPRRHRGRALRRLTSARRRPAPARRRHRRRLRARATPRRASRAGPTGRARRSGDADRRRQGSDRDAHRGRQRVRDRGRRGRARRGRPASCSARWASTRWPSCRCCGRRRVMASCTSAGWGRRGRPTSSPSRWTSWTPAVPTTPDPGPALLGDVVLCPAVAAARPAPPATPWRRAVPADRARRAAPARLRPRRARRGEGDVRSPDRSSSRAGGPRRGSP